MAAEEQIKQMFKLAFEEVQSLSAPPGKKPSTSKMLGLIAGIWIEGRPHLEEACPGMTLMDAVSAYAQDFSLDSLQQIAVEISAASVHNAWNHGGRILRKYRGLYELDAKESWWLCQGLLYRLTQLIGPPQDTANFFYMMLQRQAALLSMAQNINLIVDQTNIRASLRLLAEKIGEAVSQMPAFEHDPSASTPGRVTYRKTSSENSETSQFRIATLSDVLSETDQATPLESGVGQEFDDGDIDFPRLEPTQAQELSSKIDSVLAIGPNNDCVTAAMALGNVAGRIIGRISRDGERRDAMLRRFCEIAEAELASRLSG